MARLPEILNHEPPTWGGSKWTEDGQWTRPGSQRLSLRRYQRRQDVKLYVVKVTALLPEPVSTDVELAKSAPRLRLPQPVLVSQLRTSVTGFYSEPEESPAPEPHPPVPVYVDESLIEE